MEEIMIFFLFKLNASKFHKIQAFRYFPYDAAEILNLYQDVVTSITNHIWGQNFPFLLEVKKNAIQIGKNMHKTFME